MAVEVLGVKEHAQGERRVALTPETARKYIALGATVWIEPGAGTRAGSTDQACLDVGAQPADAARLGQADIVLCVQPPDTARLRQLKSGASLVGMLHPQADAERAGLIQSRGLQAFPLERLPRTTRAQSMDVLSSQAGMAGYKATLIAAQLAPRFFPMLTTAAGTIRPSRVLVVGAGVAGLQAIATARRLGAQVEGFDVRPETREQIESLGGKFLDLGVSAVGEGGYARPLTDQERAEPAGHGVDRRAAGTEHARQAHERDRRVAAQQRPADQVGDRVDRELDPARPARACRPESHQPGEVAAGRVTGDREPGTYERAPTLSGD